MNFVANGLELTAGDEIVTTNTNTSAGCAAGS